MLEETSLSELPRHNASYLRRALRGNVLWLGVVSLFTDVSSEMIYPLLPAFFAGLVSVPSAALWIGVMDGIAETVSAFLKLYAGRLSDRLGKRKALTVGGYAISTFARPIVAIATAPWHVVGLRFLDRVGKGIRTAPRDALIGDSVDSDVRGVAFSFHRLMDHTGAVIGPVVAGIMLFAFLGSAMLWQRGNADVTQPEMHALRIVFLLSAIPGIIALIALTLGVRDTKSNPQQQRAQTDSARQTQNRLPGRLVTFIVAAGLFSLGNSTDLFLVLYVQTTYGLGLGHVVALWISLHIAKIALSIPGGRFSDRVGRFSAIFSGWAIYVVVYASLPFASNVIVAWALIVVYGVYYGLTEGAERALVTDWTSSEDRGRAFGLYHGVIGFTVLPANLAFGFLWTAFGAQWAFFFGAGLATAAAIVLGTLALSTRGRRLQMI